MMSYLCNRCVREFLILARTWFAFGLPSKTGCDKFEGSPVYTSPPASSDDSDDSQGIAAEVWTYIRAVEHSGLEGSNESEVSSGEENSSDSSEEESGGDGDDEGDVDDGGDGDGDGDGGQGDGKGNGKGDGKSGSGSSKASGKAPLA
jgi:hypothetical protein